MAYQQIHPSLGKLNILTQDEHREVTHGGIDYMLRQRYMGVESQRIARVSVEAAATTVNVYAVNGEVNTGPESGDFWELRRVIVKSNVLTDAAKWLVFRGSSPSDTANSYSGLQLLDGFAAAGAGIPVNQGWYFPSKSVGLQNGEQIYALVLGATVGNVYMLEGEAIRVPSEMKGKLLS
jgi:hypothetical protein